jgi:hypothetical protein
LQCSRSDDAGQPDIAGARPHWQRKHPQLWSEAQQYATLRGLALRGMPTVQDTSTALLGMLWVAEHGRQYLPAYHAVVFEHVWGEASGTVDLADIAVIESFVAGWFARRNLTLSFSLSLSLEGEQTVCKTDNCAQVTQTSSGPASRKC